MQISMKDTLSELRKKKKVTQEAVAAHLGITSQSVGKWERGEGFPDITLLPALALYFGVTVDDLLGVGKARQKERINALLDGAERELLENGPAAAVEACREAYREFPNDLRIILDSAPIGRIYCNGRKSHGVYTRLIEPITGQKAECLPSTSPANAQWRLEQLTEAWSILKTR